MERTKVRAATKERSRLIYPAGQMRPTDFLNFVQIEPFTQQWESLGLDDEDLRALEVLIMIDPTRFPVVPGTGRLRKLRFASDRWSRGKRSGVRVCFAHFPGSSVVTLHAAYLKGKTDDLTPKQRKEIKKVLADIEEYLYQGVQNGQPQEGKVGD